MEEKTIELTQSEPTNRLLQIIHEVQEGKNQESALKELVTQRKNELTVSRNDFLQKITNLPSELNLAGEAQAIQESFDAYEAILKQLEEYLENHNREILENSRQQLLEVTGRFIRALNDFDQKYWTAGATAYPLINMLTRIMEGIKNGTLYPEFLPVTLDNVKNTYKQALKDLKKMPQGDGRAIKQIEEIYLDAVKILEDLNRQAAERQFPQMERGIKKLEIIQDKTDKAFQTYRTELYLTYPTASPFINLALSAIKGIKENYFTDDILSEALVILKRNYQEMLKEMETLLELPSSELVKNRPFTLMEESFALGEQYQTSKNKELLLKMEPLLTQAAGELLEVTQTNELPNTTICIKCQKGNTGKEKICAHCGAILPLPQEDDQGSTFQITEGEEAEIRLAGVVLTDNFKRILDAVDEIMEEKTSPEEFEATLNWMDTLLQISFNELRNLPRFKADNFREQDDFEQAKAGEELIDGTKELLGSGIVLAQNGLAEMRKFLEDGEREHLTNGLKVFWQGAGEISHARQIGENVTKLMRSDEQAPRELAPQQQPERQENTETPQSFSGESFETQED